MIDLHDDLAAALAHRYEVERELGHGGMAIVYLARDVKHSRRVAVKVLRPDLASSIGGERFLREISVAAALTHPNILSLHDSGAAEGLLYYVMPYIEGETLRARLDREHQLPIDEALAITRQVGAALDYAHAHGVVHRDIKPENILIAGDHVCVADFGLARALYSASTQRLTESAVAVGTPAYMSPEQAAADPDVDGRADIYSLACVLYEMIVGTAPFRGATAQALLAQHLTASAPSICAQRANCPPGVDAAVRRALEKVPADRFRTARDFIAALSVPTTTARTDTAARRRSRLPMLVGAAAIAVVGTIFVASRYISPAAPPLDDSSYLVLPTAGAPEAAGTLDQRIVEALGEWRGITVVDPRRTAEALGDHRTTGISLRDAQSAARSLGAGRFVWGTAVLAGDSLTVRIATYDAGSARELRSTRLTYPAVSTPSVPMLRPRINELLRSRDELPWTATVSSATPSLPAWQAYDRGRDALATWDVATAQHEFRSAVALDALHAQAWLWLGLTQLWSGDTTQRWRGSARRAYELRGRLATQDSLIALAQRALAERLFPEACTRFRALTSTDTTGVIAWYGLGECHSRDRVVVRDPRSRSSYRFRGSIEQAKRAYLHILDDRAPPQPAFVYARLAAVLPTGGNQLRTGPLGDSSALFGAFPSWERDSLAYVAYPLAQVMAGGGGVSTPGKATAIEQNRLLLRRLYIDWIRSAPSSVEAHAGLARLLEATEELSSGEAGTAVEQIRRARALNTDSTQDVELGRVQLRLLVKSGDWKASAALAESLMARRGAGTDSTLAGAAALTGRVRALATILRTPRNWADLQVIDPDGASLDVPGMIQQDAAPMLGYASLGVCTPELRAMPARVGRQLENYVSDASRRSRMRAALLRRPLSLAVPCLGPDAVATIAPEGEGVMVMDHALADGRPDLARAAFRELLANRANMRPGDIALDYTYLESWALAAAGDTSSAIAHLDGPLEALPTLGVYFLDFPSQSAGLVRAMALRAEIAAAVGDRPTAKRWATAVADLWASADPELQPTVQRMQRLAEANR